MLAQVVARLTTPPVTVPHFSCDSMKYIKLDTIFQPLAWNAFNLENT